MSSQIRLEAPATRVASRKLGPWPGAAHPRQRAFAPPARRAHWRAHGAGGRRWQECGRASRVDRDRTRSEAAKQPVQALVEDAGGRGRRREIPGGALEQVGARVPDPGGLGPGQRVASDKPRIFVGRHDRSLGRADVADHATAGAASSAGPTASLSALTGAAMKAASAPLTASAIVSQPRSRTPRSTATDNASGSGS